MKWKWNIYRGNQLCMSKVVGKIFQSPLCNRKHFYWCLLAGRKWPGKTKTNEAIDFKYDLLKAQPEPYPSPSIIFMSVTCGGWEAPTCSTQPLRHWLPGDQTGLLAPLCSPPLSPAQVPYRRRLTHFSSLLVLLPGENGVMWVCWVGGFVGMNKSFSSSLTVQRWRHN